MVPRANSAEELVVSGADSAKRLVVSGADSAEESLNLLWDFSANFDGIQWDFQQFFSEISGLNSEKVAAILCARLCENHKGGSPLDPRRPPQIYIL